jgi:hypothetical protein
MVPSHCLGRRGHLGLLLIAACGGATPPPVHRAAAVPSDKAEADARGLVEELYESVGRGDSDGLLPILGDQLTVVGPRVGDALVGRGDVVVALAKALGGKKRKVASTSLTVAPSRGGHSAWASDVVTIGGEPFAMTAVLTSADDLWAVAAGQLSAMPSMKRVRKADKEDAVVAPGRAATVAHDGRADDAVARFKGGLGDQARWGDDLTAAEAGVVIGPAADDLARGPVAIKTRWKKRLAAGIREVAVGPIAAGVTPDGELAWVTAPVVRTEDADDPLPLRVYAVFRHQRDRWQLVALHEALALDVPGAATADKKQAAAQAPKPAPAVEPKVEPKKDKADRKKDKKRSKRRSRDDDADR